MTRSKLNHIVLTLTLVHRYTWINVICLVGFRDHFFDGLIPSVYVRVCDMINSIEGEV